MYFFKLTRKGAEYRLGDIKITCGTVNRTGKKLFFAVIELENMLQIKKEEAKRSPPPAPLVKEEPKLKTETKQKEEEKTRPQPVRHEEEKKGGVQVIKDAAEIFGLNITDQYVEWQQKIWAEYKLTSENFDSKHAVLCVLAKSLPELF